MRRFHAALTLLATFIMVAALAILEQHEECKNPIIKWVLAAIGVSGINTALGMARIGANGCDISDINGICDELFEDD